MINYYLLKGQSEFLHVKQKQLPCLVKVCARAFWLIAGQVTQHNKWHAWSGDTCQSSHSLNVCHLFPPMLEVLFSFPTQLALFFSRFPSPYFKFSRHKCVWHKCVSWTSVPLHLHCRCYIQVLTTNIYTYTSVPPSFTLVYSQTHSLEARLWESEINAISPLSKRERCCACNFWEPFWVLAHKYTWQLT